MSLRLLFDVGNTRVKWAWHDGHDLLQNPGAASLEEFNAERVLSELNVDEVWVASMNKFGVYQDLISAFDHQYSGTSARIETVEVTQQACGINNSYEKLDQLGIDRWLSVIGARSLVPTGNVLVIDAGTAINIECLGADNTYYGGAIMPGFRLMHDSLVGRVAAINSEVMETLPSVGINTQDCINFGVGYGVAGAVERVVQEMLTLLQSKGMLEDLTATAFLAGGNAWSLETRMNLTIPSKRLDNLVLYGLLEVAREFSK